MSTASGSGKDPLNHTTTVVVPMLQLTKTPEQIAEEQRQIEQYNQRKLLAKKRREEKQQREVQRILDEKKQVENELEELKQNLLLEKQQNQNQYRPTTSSNAEGGDDLDDFASKKLQKLKKRYEKKLNATKEELEDLRDDFYYQRKQLMDAMLEQEKDCKLYEIICRSLIGDRELKKVRSDPFSHLFLHNSSSLLT